MPDYHIVIKPSAAKELDKLPISVAARIAAKIESLAWTPRPPGVKKLEESQRAGGSRERLARHLRDR